MYVSLTVCLFIYIFVCLLFSLLIYIVYRRSVVYLSPVNLALFYMSVYLWVCLSVCFVYLDKTYVHLIFIRLRISCSVITIARTCSSDDRICFDVSLCLDCVCLSHCVCERVCVCVCVYVCVCERVRAAPVSPCISWCIFSGMFVCLPMDCTCPCLQQPSTVPITTVLYCSAYFYILLHMLLAVPMSASIS